MYNGHYEEDIIDPSYNFVDIFDKYASIGIKIFPTSANVNNFKLLSKYDLAKRGYVNKEGEFKYGHPQDIEIWDYDIYRNYIIKNKIVSGYIPLYPFNKLSILDDDSHNKKNDIYDKELLKLVQDEINDSKDNLYQTTPGGGYHIIYKYNGDDGMINDLKYNGCIDRLTKNNKDLTPPCIFTGLRYDGKYISNFKKPKSMSDNIKLIAKQPKEEVKNYYKYNTEKYNPNDMKYCYKSKDLKIIVDDQCEKIFKSLDIISDNDIDKKIVDNTKIWKVITALLRELVIEMNNIYDETIAIEIKDKIHNKWKEWSKKGDKYNKVINIEIWKSSGKYNVNFNYIIEIANDFLNKKDKIKKYRTKLDYKPLNNHWDRKVINHKYLNIGYKDTKHLLIESGVNTGKTTLFKSLLKDLNKQSIITTNSKALNLQLYKDLCNVYGRENVYLIDSSEISKELNMIQKLINNYNDKSHIVICINSIEKLKPIEDKINWDNTLLFIDEFNSFVEFLYTVDRKVMKNRTVIISKIIEYIQNVSYGLYVDNKITDVENLFLQNANIYYDFYTNNYESFQGVEVNVLDKIQFDNYYSKCSKEKEKIMFCSNQKNVILSYNKLLKDNKKYNYNDGEIMCIHSESKDNFSGNREDLNNIIQFMFSPTITTGIEYINECKVFCYVKGMITITPLQVLQQIARARNPIEVNILFDNVINEYIKCSSLSKYKQICYDENVFRETVFNKEYSKIKDISNIKIDKSSLDHNNHNDILININFNKNVLNSDFKNNTLKLLSEKGYLIKTEDYDNDYDNMKDYLDFNKKY